MRFEKITSGHSIALAATLIIIVIILMVVPQEALSRTEARYELRAGDAVVGMDLYNSRSIQTLFHQQSLDVSDVEHYDLAFPLLSDSLDLGPAIVSTGATADGVSPGVSASSNVLPFGPVSLAFPSIHEDVAQTVTASQTGFFASNYNYRPEAVYGNVPLTTDYPVAVQQAISPAPLFGWSQLYPEQYDTIWIKNKLKELNTAPVSQTRINQTSTGTTSLNQPASSQSPSNQTGQALSTPLNSNVTNTTGSGQIAAPNVKPSLALNYFKPKNATTKPWDMPVVYPWVFDLAGKDQPVFPNPGIGTFSTNGAGSTGASLTGLLPANVTLAMNQTGNQTVKPTVSGPSTLTYADFNFDATTGQINNMSIVERMWRNSHRGGMMGKAYAGDTSAPIWIDPYERPYDLPIIDEHFYVLQSALNMCVPGTQIMPRFWSLGLV